MPFKILSVDDSKTIRMIVKKAFRPYDCTVAEAENGQEGLAAVEKEKPDLIVLDITMPVMNGIEMLGKLKSNDATKSIPVIMLTAESGKDNVMQIVKMGVKNYIVKPFKGEQLIERAKQVIDLKEKPDAPAVDPASKYFSLKENVEVMALPAKLARTVIVDIENFLGGKLQEMNKAGMNRFIMDLGKVSEVNMSLIKMIITTIDKCSEAKIHIRVVAGQALAAELKSFQETGDIPIHGSIEDATATFE